MAENTAPDNDGDIQLKKRARRRLVGAIALALLAAIVLPMVMDHEPRPPVQDIQVRIPSQDAGSFTSRVLPDSKPKATPLPAAPAVKPEAKPEIKSVEPVAETKPAESVTPLKPEVKAEVTKPEHKPEAKPEAKKPDTKLAEAVRAEKILSGGAEPAKTDQWVLQLGAYQDQGNVKALQAKIKELGFASYTEKVSTPQGDRIRVRAGPFNSKAAAEKAQAGLKRIGAGGPPGGLVAPK